MGAHHWKEQTMIRNLKRLAPLRHPSGSGEGLEIKLIMNHAFLSSRLGVPPSQRTHPCVLARRVAGPNSTGIEAPALKDPSQSLCTSSSESSSVSFGISLAQCRRPAFDPWVRKIPWRRKWQPTPVFLPRKSHGQNLVGYSPCGRKELDTTEQLYFHFCLQYSKLVK